MEAGIRRFINSYGQSFEQYGRAYSERFGYQLDRVLHEAVGRQKGNIYIFGNGGCHAIARCLKHALLTREVLKSSRSRVVANVDPDGYSLVRATPGPAYHEMLRRDGAGTEDLVILLSGSGESENLVEVARIAGSEGIPLIALVGVADCALESVVPSSAFFPVGIKDQQIGEDIIQYLSCLVGVGEVPPAAMPDMFSLQATCLKKLSPEFVLQAAESVRASFASRARVRVLGLGHPTMATCAEHTAHNLNWDAFYQLDSEPDVTIISSPSACDYSGISNDRRSRFLRHFSKTYSINERSTTLIFAMSLSNSLVQELGIDEESPMETFVICAEPSEEVSPRATIWSSLLCDPFSHASLVQCAGHLVGRVLRLRLLQFGEVPPSTFDSVETIYKYLTDGDLAQRRLLDKA